MNLATRHAIPLFFVLTLACPALAQDGDVTIGTFSGSITFLDGNTPPPSGLAVGQSVMGVFAYDASSAIDADPEPTMADYTIHSGFRFEITAGPVTWKTQPQNKIRIFNADIFDLFRVQTNFNDGYTFFSFQLSLWDEEAPFELVSSAELPLEPVDLDISHHTNGGGFVSWSDYLGEQWDVSIEIDRFDIYTAFRPFCFGDGGDQAGCTDCPCGNNAGAGSGGGCLNSSDESAVLEFDGKPSVSRDTLHFRLVSAVPMTFALLVSADNVLPAAGACPPGSGIVGMPPFDGLRCVGGNLLRHGTRATNSNGVSVTDWGSPGQDSFLGQYGFVAGQTRNFQVFYRDEAGLVCNSGRNTSNAVSVEIRP